MILREYRVDRAKLDFDAAHRELLAHIATRADDSHTWGYFPELAPDLTEYPQSVRLAGQLEENLFDKEPELRQQNYTLAFMRAASQEPVSEFGGLHIDVHAGIAHKRDAAVPPESQIIRVLLNPYAYPRTLRYIAMTTTELRARGFDIPYERYQILRFPADIPTAQVEIPPLEDDRLYGLQFYSSLIPHAGITDQQGHFLIAYGAYTNTLSVL